ncbi:hypothetical protein TrCOL_g10541 [Triparma columacea]|uniref:Glyoxalase/fosfomycin resistance/dioxygenase domain-containing protein n=1 Tax=Triparma columacea TaxID=722753 RepID=A0A9W7GNR1_9STRA|nr:hypothetical protein TrCOL_g10541 [Triparma columacea]
MSGILTRIILRVPPPLYAPTTTFYHKTFSLPLTLATETTASLTASEGVTIVVTCEEEGEQTDPSFASPGGTGGLDPPAFPPPSDRPMLQFDVECVQSTLLQALSNGGELDGPIKHPAHGKVAVVKDPSGGRVGMWEKIGDIRDVTG